jgi:hypothetical protein
MNGLDAWTFHIEQLAEAYKNRTRLNCNNLGFSRVGVSAYGWNYTLHLSCEG